MQPRVFELIFFELFIFESKERNAFYQIETSFECVIWWLFAMLDETSILLLSLTSICALIYQFYIENRIEYR